MQEKKSVNFQQFVRKLDQRLFFDMISHYEGTVAIVWDGKAMTTQFDTILTGKVLSDHNIKSYKLEHSGYADANNIIYLLYPTFQSVTKLLRNWLQKLPDNDLRLHHVYFLPTASYTIKQQLREDQKVWERIQSMEECQIHWFPTEQSRLITMEVPELLSQMVVNGDWNYLFRCARAIRQLEMLTGRTELSVHCKGEWSARIVDMLRKLRSDSNEKLTVTVEDEQFQDVNRIVIVDRWVDPVTPMLRQFTQVAHVTNSCPLIPKVIISVPLADFEEKEPNEQQQSANDYKELRLNDQIYEKLQDLHVNKVAGKIRELVNELKDEEQQRDKLASLAEYKNFVAKLPNLVEKKKSTGNFTRLAGIVQRYLTDEFFVDILNCEQELMRNPQPDKVVPFIENSIIESRDKLAIVRLIVLQSLYSKGLKISVLQHYIKLICQSYGIAELRWLMKLQLAGLIRDEVPEMEIRYPAAANFGQLASKKYRTNFADVDEQKRFGSTCGVSLLVRLIEEGLTNNWSEFTTVENRTNESELIKSGKKLAGEREGVTLVFVVGGITRTEVSMLNELPAKLLCCTTSLINGSDLLNSFRN